MIECVGLSKRYGKVEALKRVNLTFASGDSVALIGPNGSGKTTLIKCLLGLVMPTEGEIRVDGKSIQGQWHYRSRIGYMPQISRYPANLSVGSLLDMLRSLRKDCQHFDDDLVKAYRLEQLAGKKLGALSGGTRQKVGACITFLFNPDIIILDEPTSGLDPLSSEILKEKIKEENRKGKLIIITSHIMQDLEETVKQVVYMMDGQPAFFHTLEELKNRTGQDSLSRAIARVLTAQQTEHE